MSRDIPSEIIFPQFIGQLRRNLLLNEWLPPHTYKLLREVRDRAEQFNYERVWIRNGVIFVRKNADSEAITITSHNSLMSMV